MSRPRKRDKLNDSINIPVQRKFKHRVTELAERAGSPHTAFVRTLLEEAVERIEAKAAVVAK